MQQDWLAGTLAALASLLLITSVSITGSGNLAMRNSKPPWQPPNIVFGIVWPILYALLLLSILFAAASWHDLRWQVSVAVFVLFYVQLILNVLWPLSFKPNTYCLGVAILTCIATLILSYIAILFSFADSNKLLYAAASLPLPYLAWILFALSLNSWYC